MKIPHVRWVFILLVLSYGCDSIRPLQLTPAAVATGVNGTSPNVTPTSPTAIATMTKEQADQTVAGFMQNNRKCSTPCFWGLRPGKSTLQEAIGLMSSLAHAYGGDPIVVSQGNLQEYGYAFTGPDHLGIEISLHGQGSDLLWINAIGTGFNRMNVTDSDWQAFRPDEVLKIYGTPMQITFAAVPGPTDYRELFRYYYENFIIQYYGGAITPTPHTKICPLAAHEVQRLELWLGKGISDRPRIAGKSLHEVAHISNSEFQDLMLSNGPVTCLDFDLTSFLP